LSRCKIQEVDLGGKHEFMYEYTCKGERVAAIRAVRKKIAGKVRYVVRGVNVLEEHRRKRIGTKLYEVAAKEACRRRAPLASDERVGDMSRQFWAKQISKGRAVVLSKRLGFEKGEKAPVYSLTCPAPSSLAAPRRSLRRPARS
jgi:GNAT superfamily N-acetyltransferase